MNTLMAAIKREADTAQRKYGDFASTHEAYGVLAEEVAELFKAICWNEHVSMREEAIQISAVAMRIAKQSEWPRG